MSDVTHILTSASLPRLLTEQRFTERRNRNALTKANPAVYIVSGSACDVWVTLLRWRTDNVIATSA